MKKGERDKSHTPTAGPFNNPFGALGGLRGELPQASLPPEPPAPAGPARAVVRFERKGRGGKEVTLVEQLELGEGALASWLKELKQALGCGGALEGSALVLQGDHRPRVKAWLESRGVKRVSVG